MTRGHARLAQRLGCLTGGRHTHLLNAMTGVSSGPPTTPGSAVPHTHQVLVQTGFDFPMGNSHGHAVMTITGPAIPAPTVGPAGATAAAPTTMPGAMPTTPFPAQPEQAAVQPQAVQLQPVTELQAVQPVPTALPQPVQFQQAAQQALQPMMTQLAFTNPLLARSVASMLPSLTQACAQCLAQQPGAAATAPNLLAAQLPGTAVADSTEPQAVSDPNLAAAVSALVSPQAGTFGSPNPFATMGAVPAVNPVFPQMSMAGAYGHPAMAAMAAQQMAQAALLAQTAQAAQDLQYPQYAQVCEQVGPGPEAQTQAPAEPAAAAIVPMRRLPQPDNLVREGNNVVVRPRGVVVCTGV